MDRPRRARRTVANVRAQMAGARLHKAIGSDATFFGMAIRFLEKRGIRLAMWWPNFDSETVKIWLENYSPARAAYLLDRYGRDLVSVNPESEIGGAGRQAAATSRGGRGGGPGRRTPRTRRCPAGRPAP